MSLSDVYSDLDNAQIPFPNCKTCHWYLGLDYADRVFFDGKAADPNVNIRKLGRACEAHSGLKVAPSSLRNHVREHHKRLLVHLREEGKA